MTQKCGALNWYLGGAFSYTNGEYADGTSLPCNEFDDNGALDTCNTVDVFFGIRADQWNVELFARNLFAEEAIITGAAGSPPVRRQPTGYANRFPIPARRFGLVASYRW
ncbi:MAG: hypothetical protein V7709_20325 [Halioglobus sp.]